jgi:exonuclease III
MGTVVSWNVAGRVRSVAEQAAALGTVDADVVALQEVRASAFAAWREALTGLGYPHVAATLRDAAARPQSERRLGVLVAARAPIEAQPPLDTLPWPERHLAAPSPEPRILVGDLNTPQYESRDGEVRTFARTRAGKIRPDYGERHDAAELALIVGLRAHGYVDAFRAVHGYAARDRSWMYGHGKMGYRLDHVIVRDLEPRACAYVHAWREQGLSDHSGIWARLA